VGRRSPFQTPALQSAPSRHSLTSLNSKCLHSRPAGLSAGVERNSPARWMEPFSISRRAFWWTHQKTPRGRRDERSRDAPRNDERLLAGRSLGSAESRFRRRRRILSTVAEQRNQTRGRQFAVCEPQNSTCNSPRSPTSLTLTKPPGSALPVVKHDTQLRAALRMFLILISKVSLVAYRFGRA
jgi:hypothetical protein